MDSPAAAPQAPANAPSAFPLKPILWLLGSMTSLALGTSLAKQIFPIVGAQGTTALRLLFSALVLILFGRPWRHRMPRHDWWVVARYGMTLGMMNMLFYLALETIPFGIAVAIEFCGPLTVALFASRWPIDFVWIGCTVAGLLMLLPIWHGGGDATAAQAVIEGAAGAQAMAEGAQGVVPGVASASLDPLGMLYAAGAAVCWAGYIIFGKKTQHLHAGTTVALGVSIGALMMFPVGVVHAGAALFEPKVLLIGLGAAVVSSAIPMFLEMKALRGLQAGTYGVMTSLEPALTSVVAMLVLGELLTLTQWCAIALTVTAAMGSALTSQRGG